LSGWIELPEGKVPKYDDPAKPGIFHWNVEPLSREPLLIETHYAFWTPVDAVHVDYWLCNFKDQTFQMNYEKFLTDLPEAENPSWFAGYSEPAAVIEKSILSGRFEELLIESILKLKSLFEDYREKWILGATAGTKIYLDSLSKAEPSETDT